MNTSSTSLKKFYIVFLLLLLIVVFVFSLEDVSAAEVVSDVTLLDYISVDEDLQLFVPLVSTYDCKTSSQNLRIVFDCDLDPNSSWMVAPFASYNGSTDRGLFFLVNPITGNYSCQFGSSWNEGKNSPLGGSRHVIDMYFTYGSQVLKVDGNNYASYSFKPSYTYSVSELSLFKRQITGGSGTLCPFRGKIYSIKVYENSALTLDLVPVLTNSGFYGLMNNLDHMFYTPTSGAFTPGPTPSLPNYVPLQPGNNNTTLEQSGAWNLFVHLISAVWTGLFMKDFPLTNSTFGGFAIGLLFVSLVLDMLLRWTHIAEGVYVGGEVRAFRNRDKNVKTKRRS